MWTDHKSQLHSGHLMPMKRWQFSTRSLLALTTILSIVLAFSVRVPMLFRVVLILAAPVLLLIAIFYVANFSTSDRRPRVSLLAWALLGVFLDCTLWLRREWYLVVPEKFFYR